MFSKQFLKQRRYQAPNQKFFRAGEVLWNQGSSIYFSSKTQEKKAPQGKMLELFLLDTLKTTFGMEGLPPLGCDLFILSMNKLTPSVRYFSSFSTEIYELRFFIILVLQMHFFSPTALMPSISRISPERRNKCEIKLTRLRDIPYCTKN